MKKNLAKFKLIFYLFLVFSFLSTNFPASVFAYPAYTSNSDLVIAGPYDTATSGTGNWGCTPSICTGTGSNYREFITIGQQYRIRQNGTVSRIRIYTATATSNLSGMYLTVWRKNGANYDLVGKSDNVASHLVAGNFATIDLATPITGVQEGDYYGYRMEWTGASGSADFYAKTGITGVTSYYVTNSNPTNTGYNWAGQTNLAGAVLPIELYMTAPQIAFIGDSIIAGHPAHYSFLETTATTNINSTIEKQFGNLTGYVYQNMGIGSQTTAGISSRFTSDIISLKPKIVVIEGGVNDIAGSVAKSTFIANWTSMLDAAQASSYVTTIIVLKILPWTNGTNTQMQTRDDWNASLATLAAGYSKAIVVDASSYVGQFRAGGDANNLWDIKTAYNQDGVHYNSAGYGQVAQAIADNLPKPSATFDNDFSTWSKGNVTVNYNLIQTGGSTNINISQTDTSGIEYSTDNSTWHDATKGTGGDAMTGLTSTASPGTDHSFVWDSATDLPTTEDSTVYLRIRPNDGTNSAADWITSNAFGVDNFAPSVADNVPATWQKNNITTTLTCTDSGSGCSKVYYTTDGSTPTTGSSYVNAAGSWQFTYSTEATSTLKYRGEDSAGNLESTATASNQLRLDKTNPTINAGDDQSKSTSFTQTATASDSGSGIDNTTYQWAKVSGPGTITFGTATALSSTISADTDGTYVISFTASDAAGNSNSDNFTLTWTNPITTHTLTYTAGTHGSITGTSPQTINHGSDGSAVTAVADSGYHFVNWSDASTTNPRTDTNVTTDISVTANFAVTAPTTYSITASAGSHGSISPSGATTVNSGENQSYSITADSGYHISDVLVDGSSVGAVSSYTFNTVTADHTISATFAVTSSGGGGCYGCFVNPVIPTGGFKMSINGGASTTSNRNVFLGFTAGADIKKMAISMTGDFTDASQENYVASKQWDLCSKLGGAVKNPTCSDGKYTVYAKFYTAYGRSSDASIASSTITLKSGSVTENLQQYINLPFSNPFTKYLQYQQTNNDVKRLQIFLNSDPDTKIADSGAGSPDKETNYFGLLTYKAVIKFQEKYAKDILTPNGLKKGTGYVGKATLNKINELIKK